MAAFRECRFLSQDGRSLYYRDYGDPLAAAAPVLCLPGLTRNSKDFHSLAGRLAASRRVICPDYRGRGQSEYDRDPRNYHPAVHLNDTRHLMTVTGLDDVVVVGTSFGGLLAIGLAIISPSSLRAVVLNDVGPEVSNKGLRRIMDYIGKDNPQTDWDAAAAEVARMFPTLSGQSRAALLNEAQATWREGDDGMLHFDWDTRLVEAVTRAQGKRPLGAVSGAAPVSGARPARRIVRCPQCGDIRSHGADAPGSGHRDGPEAGPSPDPE